MPFIVVTTAEKKTRSAEADAQAARSLQVAERVFEILSPWFEVESWEVWESTPRPWLGGIRKDGKGGPRRPRDFAVPVPTPEGTTAFETAPTESKTQVHSSHCVMLHGSFSLAPQVVVPASFSINLAVAYAHGTVQGKAGAGDIVFDTQRTAQFPAEGLYDLLRMNQSLARPFLMALRDQVFHINDRISEGPTIRWASLKAFEGSVEPTTSCFFLYRKDPTSLGGFLKGRLLEVALERGKRVYDRSRMVPAAVYRDIVAAIVNRISLSPAYSRAAARRGELKSMFARPGGSVMISTDNPEAPTEVAEEVIDAVSDAFLTDLARQLGASEQFEQDLERLAEREDYQSAKPK